MKDLRKIFTLLFVLGAVIALVAPASAQSIITAVVDEFGNSAVYFDSVFVGSLPPAFFAPDPGPGGLSSVLTYPIPVTVVPGDVLLTDADFGGLRLDVVRFNTDAATGTSTLLFYSDNLDGFDAPADTSSPPSAFYTNLVSIPEIGTEAFNYSLYSPGPNDPGFVSVADAGVDFTPTYMFVSDGSVNVPEPSTILLLSAGLAGIVLLRRKLRKVD
jgi:hypothetical protein